MDTDVTYIGKKVTIVDGKNVNGTSKIIDNKFHQVDSVTPESSMRIDRVPLEVSKAIEQARQQKGWTRKQLAAAVGEKLVVIADYENGKAIPNNSLIAKMEKAMGIKLSRPSKRK